MKETSIVKCPIGGGLSIIKEYTWWVDNTSGDE